MVKPRLYSTEAGEEEGKRAALWTLQNVLIDALKLLHPYMPFITEEIFCTLQTKEESIMVSEWPVFCGDRQFAKEENAIELMKEAVRRHPQRENRDERGARKEGGRVCGQRQ